MTLPNDLNAREHRKFDEYNNVKMSLNNTLITQPFDYIGATYPSDTTEVYTYKNGGASGTTVGIVTVTYSDSTKAVISSVEKS